MKNATKHPYPSQDSNPGPRDLKPNALALSHRAGIKYYCGDYEKRYTLVSKIDENGDPDIKNSLLELLRIVKDKNIKMLSTMIPSDSMKTCKNQLQANKTFAEAVKEPAIIIKPVQEQTSNTTIDEIQTQIDPTKLAVGINTMKSTRDGEVVISCTDKKSMETMKNKVIEELGDKYTINMTQLKNPRAIVVGVEEKIVNMGEEYIKDFNSTK